MGILTDTGIGRSNKLFVFTQARSSATGLRHIRTASMNRIKVRGARQHNLKNIDVDVPRGLLTVITGLSGSGKSTLAFDTLYAEGQRRYVESLSTYARQFLERLPKPDMDLIEGLSPAIAIEQKTSSHNPRSTVGTVTEIHDYLRLLFSRVGTQHCPFCGGEVTSQSVDQMVSRITGLNQGSRIILLAPLVKEQKGTHATLLRRLKKDGFARVRIDGVIQELETVKPLSSQKHHSIDVVVDRLVVKPGLRNRLADSLELALSLSNGQVIADVSEKNRGMDSASILFSEKAVCHKCNKSFDEPTPSDFSFNSPKGACPQCDGLGVKGRFDHDLIVLDNTLSLKEGAVSLWANRSSAYFESFLKALTSHFGADMDTPFNLLPEALKTALFAGTGVEKIRFSVDRKGNTQTYDKPFEGIIPILEQRYRSTESNTVREDIQQYMTFDTCPFCKGARLKPESLAVRINGVGIHEVSAMPVDRLRLFFRKLAFDGKKAVIAAKISGEILQRLEFICDVGLGYLSLGRSANTLSGGENQRIRLATQIGAKLSGVLYVLDEPSIGLHPRDNRRLLQTLTKLRDHGNTVLVVEHDHESIAAADYIIDMGPGAGTAGGHVIFNGPPQALASAKESLTGKYYSGKLSIPIPAKRRHSPGNMIFIQNASRHNLKKVQVCFPLGCFVCVTGVSGSGKSTLVIETLYEAARKQIRTAPSRSEQKEHITGLEHIDKVIHIDQAPIGKTPRSNPATYTGVFAFIRDLFARTPDARMRGYTASRFSFNTKGGRCESCGGDGIVKIEMHFLPDLYVPCDICHGRRYNRETLDIRYKGMTIAQVLDMTIEQAFAFFKNVTSIRDKLQTLIDVGLGYIQLGQPATTLSGGEAQRIKLSRELSRKATGKTLYIFDEPTTGLHMDDINRLLAVINRLVDNGNTAVVIEHHLDVIKTADYIIDLGPEGGDGGGYVIGVGTPEEIASMENSYTGQYLQKILS